MTPAPTRLTSRHPPASRLAQRPARSRLTRGPLARACSGLLVGCALVGTASAAAASTVAPQRALASSSPWQPSARIAHSAALLRPATTRVLLSANAWAIAPASPTASVFVNALTRQRRLIIKIVASARMTGANGELLRAGGRLYAAALDGLARTVAALGQGNFLAAEQQLVRARLLLDAASWELALLPGGRRAIAAANAATGDPSPAATALPSAAVPVGSSPSLGSSAAVDSAPKPAPPNPGTLAWLVGRLAPTRALQALVDSWHQQLRGFLGATLTLGAPAMAAPTDPASASALLAALLAPPTVSAASTAG